LEVRVLRCNPTPQSTWRLLLSDFILGGPAKIIDFFSEHESLPNNLNNLLPTAMSQLQKTASVEPERCLGGKEAAEADAVIAKRRGPPRGHNGGPEIRAASFGG